MPSGREELAAYPNVDGVVRLCARHRLRHGRRRRRVRGAAARDVGLCPASQPCGRSDGGSGLRDEPDRLAAGGLRAEAGPNVSGDEHPVGGGAAAHHRSGDRQGPRDVADRQRGAARPLPGVRADGRAAMRRLGRVVGDHREPGAGLCLRSAGGAGRHRRAGRNARDLRRRTPADPPRGGPQGRREADRPDPLVGGLHRPQQGQRWTTTPARETRRAG